MLPIQLRRRRRRRRRGGGGNRPETPRESRYNLGYDFENERFLVHCRLWSRWPSGFQPRRRRRPPRTISRRSRRSRVQIDMVTNDVVVKDEKGNFVPNLTKDDFEIYEDGVKQDIASLTVINGGRVTNMLAPPPRGRARRHHPAAAASDEQRRLGPHLPVLRRRSAPAVPQHRTRARAVQEDRQEPGARRRHVRHRLERPVVDRDRHDVRHARGSTKRSRRSPATS